MTGQITVGAELQVAEEEEHPMELLVVVVLLLQEELLKAVVLRATEDLTKLQRPAGAATPAGGVEEDLQSISLKVLHQRAAWIMTQII